MNHKNHIVFWVLSSLCLAWGSASYPWANGPDGNGFTDTQEDFDNPPYATHDWIAHHAMMMLPTEEREWIENHFNAYLIGTEAPDNADLFWVTTQRTSDRKGTYLVTAEGYGDVARHHNYYNPPTFAAIFVPEEDDASVRAQEEFEKAAQALEILDYTSAAFCAGSMTHYIADVAVFGHVMGEGSLYPPEKHHSHYEEGVKDRTTSYDFGVFEKYLAFDGSWDFSFNLAGYEAALVVGQTTDWGNGRTKPAVWMDDNFPTKYTTTWNPLDSATPPEFTDSCGESLNRAVNACADVLHLLSTKPETQVQNGLWGRLKAFYR